MSTRGKRCGRAAEEDNGRGRERVMAPANLAAARGRRRLRFWAVEHKVEEPWCVRQPRRNREREGRISRKVRGREAPRENVSRWLPSAMHTTPSFTHRDFPYERDPIAK